MFDSDDPGRIRQLASKRQDEEDESSRALIENPREDKEAKLSDEEIERISSFQELLTEAYEQWRARSKKRNPSDSDFAKYLGVKPPAFNHWINDARRPDLLSVLKLSRGLAKIDYRFRWRIFDVLGIPRIYIAPTSILEFYVENFDLIPDDIKDQVDNTIEQYQQMVQDQRGDDATEATNSRLGISHGK